MVLAMCLSPCHAGATPEDYEGLLTRSVPPSNDSGVIQSLLFGAVKTASPVRPSTKEPLPHSAAFVTASVFRPDPSKRINVCPTRLDDAIDSSRVVGVRTSITKAAILPPAPGTSLGSRTMRFGPLDRSLRETLSEDGIPADILAQIANVFSHGATLDIDAPPRAGDSYRISYQDEEAGPSVQGTRLTAVVLRIEGRLFTAELFKPSRESVGSYFSFDGRSLSSEPFLSPVKNATVTSPFGIRLHPVKGVMREHTGVDLAAGLGTPVTAAADGTVEVVGYDKRGYGRYVVVQHDAEFSTWYAHLSAVAKSVKVGVPLIVGQVLGSVGRTGDATGPHLHFEVRYREIPTDPMHLTAWRQPAPLAADDVAALRRQTAALLQRIAEYKLTSTPNVSAGAASQPRLNGSC